MIQFLEFKHFKTETYVYWRFKLISRKGNMTVTVTLQFIQFTLLKKFKKKKKYYEIHKDS